MTQQKTFLYFWLPVLFYAGLIFTLSSFPVVFPPAFGFRFSDKILHTIEYGILGFLLARAFLKGSPPFFRNSFQFWAAAIAVVYGFTDELHQFYVPMRECSSFDLLFDGLGAILAQLIFFNRIL